MATLDAFRPVDLSTPFPGDVLHAAETTSTMDAAADAIRVGRPGHGTVFWTDHQRDGRGRLPGRNWSDEPGASLLFTLLLERAALSTDAFLGDASSRARAVGAIGSIPALSLRIGLALAELVEAEASPHLPITVKWPNDILLGGRKLAGILTKQDARWIQLGIGVNLRPGSVPPTLRERAISLEEGALRPPPSSSLLAGTLFAIEAELSGGRPWVERLNHILAYRGERVTVESSAFPVNVSGEVGGVEPTGALRLDHLRPAVDAPADLTLPDRWLCYDGELHKQ